MKHDARIISLVSGTMTKGGLVDALCQKTELAYRGYSCLSCSGQKRSNINTHWSAARCSNTSKHALSMACCLGSPCLTSLVLPLTSLVSRAPSWTLCFRLPLVFAGTLDEEYPGMCTNTMAAVSAVHFYEANYLPERYENGLFVGDYSKVSTHGYVV